MMLVVHKTHNELREAASAMTSVKSAPDPDWDKIAAGALGGIDWAQGGYETAHAALISILKQVYEMGKAAA